MAKATTKTFEIVLRGRKGQPDSTVTAIGAGMFVSARGDLCILEKVGDHYNQKAVCAFHTGCWLTAKQIETETAE